MAKLYLFVFILFLASVFLFVAAFVYLDKAKHKTYYYTINLDGHDVGAIRIEKFLTEDKILYKSLTDIPFGLLVTSEKRKIVLNLFQERMMNIRNLKIEGLLSIICLKVKAW